ncbi:MAG: hypothetical protein KAR11_01530 [Phycisphaerae bacterium]|nr:hypothetical protein [Phycisphaerae bacterium]
MIANLFYNPMQIPWSSVIWYVLPLCLSVTIVYKTVRTRNLRKLPLQSAILLLYLLGCLGALGAGLWILQRIFL